MSHLRSEMTVWIWNQWRWGTKIVRVPQMQAYWIIKQRGPYRRLTLRVLP